MTLGPVWGSEMGTPPHLPFPPPLSAPPYPPLFSTEALGGWDGAPEPWAWLCPCPPPPRRALVPAVPLPAGPGCSCPALGVWAAAGTLSGVSGQTLSWRRRAGHCRGCI